MSDIEKRLALAQKLVSTGQSERAIETYDAILAETPEEPEALRMRGLAALQLSQAQTALDYLRRAAEADPASPLPWDHMAEAYALLEDAKNAIAASQEAVKRAPQAPEPLIRLAAMLQRYRNLPLAKAAAEKALTLGPKMSGAIQLYGGVLCELGEFSAAADALAAPRQDDEALADPNAWLVKSLIASGQETAIFELPPARELKQRHAETVLGAVTAWRRGEFETAETLLDQAQALSKRGVEKDRPWSQQKLLEGLLTNRKVRRELYEPEVAETLPVVGDNLALCLSGLLVTPGGEGRRLVAHSLLFGRFRRFGAGGFPAADSELDLTLERIAAEAPAPQEVLFAFGELNFRVGREVLPRIRVEGDARALKQLTVFSNRTLGAIMEKCAARGLKPALATAPHQVMTEGLAEGDRAFLDRAVRHVNDEIKAFAEKENLRLVDFQAATAKDDGSPDRSLYFFESYPRPTVLAKAVAKAFT